MVLIRPAVAADAAAIAAVYAPFVTASRVSFEEEAPDAAEMGRRIAGGGDIAYPWLVAEDSGAMIGFTSSGPFRYRSAYRWAVETGVYVAPDVQRRGVARALGLRLIEELAARGFVTAIASITLPNAASVGFHEALGYTQVGRIEGAGFKLGEWADIGYWQRDIAERRVPPGEPGVAAFRT